MKPIPLLLIIALFLSGCGAQSYVPGLDASKTPVPTSETATPLPTYAPSPTAPSTWTVCTGLPNGSLHVRACAGVGCKSETTLREGSQISTTGERAHLGNADWMELAIPVTGWVNADYLCKPPINLMKGK